jgi:hypothetical protein
MKDKSRLEKIPPVQKEAPLKADELIDLLEGYHKQTLKEIGETIHNTLPVLLLLEEVMINAENISPAGAGLRIEGIEVDY